MLSLPNNKTVDIKFLKTGNIRTVNSSRLTDLSVKDNSGNIKLGDIFSTNEGYKIKVIDVVSQSKIKIKFLDEYGYEKYTTGVNIRRLYTENPHHPRVCGIGFRGVGENKVSVNGVHTKQYSLWKSILERVTSCKEPHYDNVYICDEWLNFQNFADWYNDNYPYNIKNIKFEIDKDLLQLNVKDKIYSPSNCVFLPKRINLFLIKTLIL